MVKCVFFFLKNKPRFAFDGVRGETFLDRLQIGKHSIRPPGKGYSVCTYVYGYARAAEFPVVFGPREVSKTYLWRVAPRQQPFSQNRPICAWHVCIC